MHPPPATRIDAVSHRLPAEIAQRLRAGDDAVMHMDEAGQSLSFNL
jgi:hypothetical protein